MKPNKLNSLSTLALLCCFIIVGKSQEQIDQSIVGNSELLVSSKQIGSDPNQIDPLVKASNDLGFKILSKIAENGSKSSNYAISPWALWSSLEMIHQASQGITADQIKTILALNSPLDISSQAILDRFVSLESSVGNQYKIFNALITQSGLKLSNEYEKLIQNYFKGSGLTLEATNEALEKVNEKIFEKTQIPNALTALPIEMMMILMSAVSFDANWLHPFYRHRNIRDTFFGYNESSYEDVHYMEQSAHYGFIYLNELDVDLIEIPLKSQQSALYIILPRNPDDDLEEIRTTLNATYIETIISKLSFTYRSTIFLPKIENYRQKHQLSELFKNFEMKAPFSRTDADLCSMSESKVQLYLDEFIHQIQLNLTDIDRETIETDANNNNNNNNHKDIGDDDDNNRSHQSAFGSLSERLMFNLNHPFLYFAREKQSGLIFLLGEIHSI
ncbi:polyglutamine-binding protein 1 [Sarcoptes scabiei]|nr:polyglutamine-binding protein 1 [Sarcoptes scabiei]